VHPVHYFTLIAIALAPALFWLWYFYRRDKFEPEPKVLVLKIFFWGMLLTFPIILIEGLLPTSEFILGIIIAPVIEECGKYLVVVKTVYKNPEFNEPMDGIVYATTAALGFAAIENILYITQVYLQSPIDEIVTVYALRALLSVPGHALFSSIWGYALGRAKFEPLKWREGFVTGGLFLAIFLHGCFNFLLIDVPIYAIGMLILIPVLWALVNRNIADALRRNPPQY